MSYECLFILHNFCPSVCYCIMELLLLFIDKIVTPKLSKHVGTQKARTSTHFLLKFWSEFYDCRMQLQSGGTPGCGCVAVWLCACILLACWRITFQIFTMYNVGSKLFR